MKETLKQLYDTFYLPSEQDYLQKEIDACHHRLVEILSKEQRRDVLRIIDAYTMLVTIRGQESFQCGIGLGVTLQNELSKLEKGYTLPERGYL